MLKDQIREQLKDAMRARDELRVNVLRGAIAAFTNELVAQGKKPTDELTDQEQVVVLKRLAKQRRDSVEQFTAGNRPELAEKESQELKIIETFLPASASREDIERVAKQKKEELGVTDVSGMGRLTGAVMKEFAGGADGNEVRAAVAALFT